MNNLLTNNLISNQFIIRSINVFKQAAWALGNVAGDSVACRDLVLAQGALPALLQVSLIPSHILQPLPIINFTLVCLAFVFLLISPW